MTIDVRSLREWVADLFNRGRLSRGGPLDLAEATHGLHPGADREVPGGTLGTHARPAQHKAARRHVRE